MKPQFVVDKENNLVHVKISVREIKLKKEKKVYYYNNDAEQLLREAGFKPVRCVATCHVNNVEKKNLEGTWIFEVDLPKSVVPKKRKRKVVKKPIIKKVESKLEKNKPTEEVKPTVPTVSRKRRRRIESLLSEQERNTNDTER